MPTKIYSNFHRICKLFDNKLWAVKCSVSNILTTFYSYGITNSSYQWLLDHNEDQCIVLSGESNSGKTESCRLVVHFLTHVSDARGRSKLGTNNRQKHSSVSFSSAKHGLSGNTNDTEKIVKQRSFDIDKSILKVCVPVLVQLQSSIAVLYQIQSNNFFVSKIPEMFA